jgi:maltose-binding protein MalE
MVAIQKLKYQQLYVNKHCKIDFCNNITQFVFVFVIGAGNDGEFQVKAFDSNNNAITVGGANIRAEIVDDDQKVIQPNTCQSLFFDFRVM